MLLAPCTLAPDDLLRGGDPMSLKIDCDSHFLPHDAFDDMDPKYFDRGPHFVYDNSGGEVVVYRARAEQIPHFMWNYPTCLNMGRHYRGTWDCELRAADLEKIGFDRQVLVPNNAPFAYDV